jgi:hypothetical protein
MSVSVPKRCNGLWHTFLERKIKKLEGFIDIDSTSDQENKISVFDYIFHFGFNQSLGAISDNQWLFLLL